MTDERFARLRLISEATVFKRTYATLSLVSLLSECLDEIERLNGGIKSLLAKLDESKEHYGPP